MPYSTYELHNEYDAEFPLRFHLDEVQYYAQPIAAHWHEHIELLYVFHGSCEINGGGVTDTMHPGDVVMFSPDCPHAIRATEDKCRYYCITIDRRFCSGFGIPVSRGQFSQIARGGDEGGCFAEIVRLMADKPICYRVEVKALLLRILAMMYRSHDSCEIQQTAVGKNKMIAQAIEYLNAHFSEPVTVEELAEYVGFSKYYFCRRFREVTGKTVVDYINFLRCTNAKRLISSGQYNVSESAMLSGFNNLSYFSRTYTKLMGKLPSDEKK